MKFYDIAYLVYHIPEVRYDVIFFRDKGLIVCSIIGYEYLEKMISAILGWKVVCGGRC